MLNKNQESHYYEYRKNGYTIFKNFMEINHVMAVRKCLDILVDDLFRKDENKPRAVIYDSLNEPSLSPLLKKHILNPTLLNFAELVMGPYVQLDALQIAGFPIKQKVIKNQVDRWHRDAFNLTETWANFPFSYIPKSRPYTAPMACNCLTYLQDMNDDTGSLRVIPGSHLDYTFIDKIHKN